MNLIVIFAAALLGLLGAAIIKQTERGRAQRPDAGARSEAWDAAIGAEDSTVTRILLSVSRPISDVPSVYTRTSSKAWDKLQGKLLAADRYGGSVEVFLTTMAVACTLGAAAVVFAAVFLDGLMFAIVTVVAALLVYLPYDRVASRAKRREAEVLRNLPDFADLLLMSVRAGKGAISALRSTAERCEGPVADEVNVALRLINTNAMPEEEAFRLAGLRLGSTEAQDFFHTIADSYLRGSKMAETLSIQAATVREIAYQHQREVNERLPLKLMAVSVVHFLPPVLVIVVVPAIASMGAV